MNLRWEAFRAGSGVLVRVVYLRGGRRVVVLDRARRARSAARRLAAAGMPPREIAQQLGRPLSFVTASLV